MNPALSRLGSPLALLCAVLAAAPRALPAEPAAEPVLELPPMTVTEPAGLPEPEAWRYARVGSFDVLSNASDRTTRQILADFEKFQHALRLVWAAPVKPVASASIILCGAKNRFDAFLPTGATTNSQGNLVPSLFLRNRELVAIVVDVESQRVTVNDSADLLATGSTAVEYEVDHYRQLYREYVHFLLSQGEVRPPAWLEEGFAQIVMDIDLTDRSLILGKVETERGSAVGGSPLETDETDATIADLVVGEQPFNKVLRYQKLLPLGQFFAIGPDAPEARHPLGNNVWAKQAYAFVHFCLFGGNLRYKDALVAFAGRLAREPLSEALFKECFKVDYRKMQEELRGYILYTRHKYQRYDLKPTDRVKPDDIALADATPGQIAVIKGDAFRLAAHPELAYGEYRNAYRRGAREPELLAGLGLTVADQATARKFVNTAVDAGAKRPSVYLMQATTRLAEFKREAGPDGKLTQVQVGAVLTPLFKARTLPPPLPEVYETIAEAWALSAVRPKPPHLAVLDEGVRQFPRDSALLLRAALLYEEAGAPETAAAIARLGTRFATEPAAARRFEELLARLPQPPPVK